MHRNNQFEEPKCTFQTKKGGDNGFLSIKGKNDKSEDGRSSLTNRLGRDVPLWKWQTITEVLSECLLIMPARLPFR